MSVANLSEHIMASAGLSGLALYVPRPRVELRALAAWTAADPAKLAAVVGDAFRVPQSDEDVYTMAAAAVLRLMQSQAIDPMRVGMLALGTESSLDNAVGAVIVRGMVDDALRREVRPTSAAGTSASRWRATSWPSIPRLAAASATSRCSTASTRRSATWRRCCARSRRPTSAAAATRARCCVSPRRC